MPLAKNRESDDDARRRARRDPPPARKTTSAVGRRRSYTRGAVALDHVVLGADDITVMRRRPSKRSVEPEATERGDIVEVNWPFDRRIISSTTGVDRHHPTIPHEPMNPGRTSRTSGRNRASNRISSTRRHSTGILGSWRPGVDGSSAFFARASAHARRARRRRRPCSWRARQRGGRDGGGREPIDVPGAVSEAKVVHIAMRSG